MRKTLRIKKKNWGAISKNCRKWVLRKNLPLSHQCPKTYTKSEKIFEKISEKVWENLWKNLRNISQNFSGIIFDFLIFQFSDEFWEIFQISSVSSRLSLKTTKWETKISRKIRENLHLKNSVRNLIFSAKNFYFNRIQQIWEHDNFEKIEKTQKILRDIPTKFGK